MRTLVKIELDSGVSVVVEAPIRVAGHLSSLVTDAGQALDLDGFSVGDRALLVDPSTGEAFAAIEMAENGLRAAWAGRQGTAVFLSERRWPEFVLMSPWHARLVDPEGRTVESWGAATEALAHATAALRSSDQPGGRGSRLRVEVARHATEPREDLVERLDGVVAGLRP